MKITKFGDYLCPIIYSIFLNLLINRPKTTQKHCLSAATDLSKLPFIFNGTLIAHYHESFKVLGKLHFTNSSITDNTNK